MAVESKRCAHCKQPYIYHPSSYGDEDVGEYNHHDYCPECYQVVKALLASIPVKYERRFVPANVYTREQIISHQEERCKTGMPIRRIFPTMIDTTGKDRHNIVCEPMPDGAWHMAEWWSNEPDKVQIKKEIWYKLC